MEKHTQFYRQYLSKFEHTLTGSYSIVRRQEEGDPFLRGKKLFRDFDDVDLIVPDSPFLLKYLKTNHKELEIADLQEHYEGISYFAIKFDDGSKIDVFEESAHAYQQHVEIFQGIKHKTLKAIILKKKQILLQEAKRDTPRVEVLVKHIKDLEILNSL